MASKPVQVWEPPPRVYHMIRVVFLVKEQFKSEADAAKWDEDVDGDRTVNTLACGEIHESLLRVLYPLLQSLSKHTAVFGAVGSSIDAINLMKDRMAVFVDREYVVAPEQVKLAALPNGAFVTVAIVPQDVSPWDAIKYEFLGK